MHPVLPTRISEIVERCGVLRRQEEEIYTFYDYLSPHSQVKQEQMIPNKRNVSPTLNIITTCSWPDSSNFEGINEAWRENICEWAYQVIDHFDFNREVAFISLNYFDRYLSAKKLSALTANLNYFELAAVTSLYIAVKVHESITPTASSFVDMSSGRFKREDLVAMEHSILFALSWYMNPPTPLSFVRNYMILLDESGCSSAVADEINEKARFLTELSVCDYYFTTRKSSLIGLGTVLAAFKCFDEAFLSTHVRCTFQELVRSVVNIDPSSDEMMRYTARLSEYRMLTI